LSLRTGCVDELLLPLYEHVSDHDLSRGFRGRGWVRSWLGRIEGLNINKNSWVYICRRVVYQSGLSALEWATTELGRWIAAPGSWFLGERGAVKQGEGQSALTS